MDRRRTLKSLLTVATVLLVSMLVVPLSQAADLAGSWEGRWMSCKAGHQS